MLLLLFFYKKIKKNAIKKKKKKQSVHQVFETKNVCFSFHVLYSQNYV